MAPRTFLPLSLLLAAPFVAQAAEPFLELTLDQALFRAAEQKRPVFVDFYATWCVPCKQLDETTWKDPKVMELLRTRTVPLELDAEREKALSEKYKIVAYPTLLLLRPDGTVLDRMTGYRSPAEFLAGLQASLDGKPAQARGAGGSEEPTDERTRLNDRWTRARAGARSGPPEEALKEYLWLYDEGMKGIPAFRGAREAGLAGEIAELGKTYPPALEALRQRAEASRAQFLARPADGQSLMEFTCLDRILGQRQASLKVLDQLPADSPGRGPLAIVVRDLLVEAGRYREAMDCRPLAAWYAYADPIAARARDARTSPNGQAAFGTFWLKAALEEVEVLVGQEALDDAKVLLARMLAFDPGAATRARAAEVLQRAGHPDLLK